MGPLRVASWGTGDPVLLLHGALLGGRPTWSPLRGLSARWRLLVPNRRGYQPGPRVDLECQHCDVRDAASLLSRLGGPAHVIGHSRGAVVALGVARRHPELVRSLVLLEPPPLGADDQVSGQVRRWRAALAELDARFPRDEDLLAAFFRLVGASDPAPDPLPDIVRRHIALLRRSPPPWAEEDLLSGGPLACPVMVVSGGHSEIFEGAADLLAGLLDARRARLVGRGHLLPAHPDAEELIAEFLLQVCDNATRHPLSGSVTPTTVPRQRLTDDSY